MASKAVIGRKVGMTQIWNEDNEIVPVTVVEVTPNRVVQVKRPDTDGYIAVQVATGEQKPSRLTQPELGHLGKAGVSPGMDLSELRLDSVDEIEVGSAFGAETFEAGDRIDVSAVSKGKGFAGAMKRHGFSGHPASHGAHRVHRAPGAIGACATPARVFKGTRMAGRMGGERVTTQNLVVVRVDTENNVLLVRGSVPGPKGGIVEIRNAVKASN